VWSADAWIARRRGAPYEPEPYPIAPLRLIRFQIGVIYLSTGLRKLASAQWRDGSAIHYAVNHNVYQRFPYVTPVWLDPVMFVMTYVILFWELSFLFALAWPFARRVVLWLGVMFHIGMFAAIEIGPFPWVMLAGYAAFLDPDALPELPQRARSIAGRIRATMKPRHV